MDGNDTGLAGAVVITVEAEVRMVATDATSVFVSVEEDGVADEVPPVWPSAVENEKIVITLFELGDESLESFDLFVGDGVVLGGILGPRRESEFFDGSESEL